MQRSLLVLFLLGACAGTPQNRVMKAVEAMGGLERMKAVTSAKVTSQGRVAEIAYPTRQYFRLPADWRMDVGDDWFTIWVLGPAHDVTFVVEGRARTPRGDRHRTTVIQGRVAATTFSPGLLLRANVELENAGSKEIDGSKHRAVDAYFKGDPRPIRYYFSKSGLLRRVEYEVWDEEALGWVKAVADLTDYREVDGIKLPHKATFLLGDRMLVEDTVESVELNPSLPDGTFTAPEAQPPPKVELRIEADRRCAVHTFRGKPGEQVAALGRVMAWIAAHGGQSAGPPSLLFKNPTNHLHPERNEVVIHVPVTMEKAPADGDIALGMRGSFLLAFVRYEGSPMAAVGEWAEVFEWCEENGYERIGFRRMRTLAMDEKTGRAVIEVGFPVRKKQSWR